MQDNDNNNKTVNKGHRKRTKKRYLETSGVGFSDHELIELLLFYAQPRCNTNLIAHELVERFGTIGNIARASVDELRLVKGVGYESAILIKLVMELAKKCISEERAARKRLNTLKKLVDYAKGYFFGATGEQVYLVMMDSTLRVIETRLICIGAIDEVKPLTRKIIEHVLLKRASAVALTHNHPSGGVEASRADVEFTLLLKRELEMIDVRFIEHVIIDGKSYTAVLDTIESSDIDGEASGENADNDNLNKNDRDYSFDDPRIKNTDPKGTEK